MRILTSPGTAAKAACHLVLQLSILLGAAAIYGSIPGTTISVLPVSPANPTSLAVGGDGNIWYREADTGQATSFVIGRFDPKGASPARFTIPAPGGCKISLGAIATGPDGNIWIAYVEQATSCTGFNSVGGLIRIMPDGTSAAFPVANVINAADALIAGPDGNLWFTDGPNSYVYRLTTAGAGTRFDVSSASPLGLSAGIAIASDGNLWITFGAHVVQMSTGGSFKIYALPDSAAGITAGPDGNLWLPERNKGNVIRLTTAGVVTEFPVSASTQLDGIATGADNNVWFIEVPTRQLDRLQVSTASAATFSVSAVGEQGTGTATIDRQPLPNGSTPGKIINVPSDRSLILGGQAPPAGSSGPTTNDVFKATVPACPGITVTFSTTQLRQLASIPVTITATGGTAPYTFTATGLPKGMSIAGNQISGRPLEVGSFPATVLVTDSGGCNATVDVVFVVAPACLVSTSISLPTNAQVGIPATGSVTASGGAAPYTFTASGLPPGLSMSGGQISGTPTQAGSFVVTITVTDANGCTVIQHMNLVVAPATCNLKLTANFGEWHAGQRNTGTFDASSGTPPYTFTLSAPAGYTGTALTNSELVAGVPAVSGPITFSATVTDARGCTAYATVEVIVKPPCGTITITPTTLHFDAGSSVHGSFTASGGAPPYRFDASRSYALPTGLTLLSDGKFTGVPTEASIFNTDIYVTDSAGCSLTQRVIFVIDTPAPPSCGSIGVAADRIDLAAGIPADIPFSVTPPGTYTLSANRLPNGLHLDGMHLLGTPTTVGTTISTITATGGTCPIIDTFAFTVASAPLCGYGLSVPDQNITTADTLQLHLTGFVTGSGSPPFRFDLDQPVSGVTMSGDLLTAHFVTTGTRTIDVTAHDFNTCPAHAHIHVNVRCPQHDGVGPADDQPCPATASLEVIKVHYLKADSDGKMHIRYQLALLNKGKDAYSGTVDVTDPLPKEVTGTVTPAEGATYDATTRTMSFKGPVNVVPGGFFRIGRIDAAFTADDGATVTNTATVKLEGAGTKTVTDKLIVGGSGGKIAVRKQHDFYDRTTDPFFWTIEITNKGSGNVNAIEIVDILPPGVVVDEKAFADTQAGVGDFSVSGQLMRISLQPAGLVKFLLPIAPGQTIKVKIPCKKLPASGQLVNGVLVWGDGLESAAFERDEVK